MKQKKFERPKRSELRNRLIAEHLANVQENKKNEGEQENESKIATDTDS